MGNFIYNNIHQTKEEGLEYTKFPTYLCFRKRHSTQYDIG